MKDALASRGSHISFHCSAKAKWFDFASEVMRALYARLLASLKRDKSIAVVYL